MKCLVLAGGRGERLWPLSRKNFPKQFIKVQKNHSIFQETIARNIAYCDEFIIVTNYEYHSIIANQMEVFQGVLYRCVYEEQPRNTTAAIVLSCLSLQPSEYVFVVAADHLIDVADCNGLSYKTSILKAKEYATEGRIVLFGKRAEEIVDRFGYITADQFYEKPGRRIIKELSLRTDVFQNLGMMLFQNGAFLHELNRIEPMLYDQSKIAYGKRKAVLDGVLYQAKVQELLTPISIEKSVIEKTDKLYSIEIGFGWNDVGSLEDLSKTGYQSDGIAIQNESANTVLLNLSPRQAVVVNDLDNILVVNTSDAVYIGRRGKSHLLKQIIHDNPEIGAFTDEGTTFYRSWGYYEQLIEEKNYRIRKVFLLPGKTIYEHRHEERKENWTVVQGTVLITLDGESKTYYSSDNIDIPPGIAHRISNVGEQLAMFIETAVGNVLHGGDTLSNSFGNVTETDLGLQLDSMIKLSPAFKDYLWGGTKLRDVYGKLCDFDVIAESWELSAHPAGNSVVVSGRHKGLSFSKYLEIVGKQVLGWKCAALQAFPLLIKFIDAKHNLSVQVHPNDDYALENENEYGKNEMWYVIDSEPGSGLYVGFNRDVTKNEVKKRIADNTIMDILNFCPTKPGDVFFIPAGTVHAIGAGNLICEIQQSSNCTYRLYDYGRCDKFCNPRELHLQKALDVLNYKAYEPIELEETDGKIRCKYFEVSIVDVYEEKKIHLTDDSFYSVTCIKGEGKIQIDEDVIISEGDTFFIPATDNTMVIKGKCSLIISRV